MTSEEHVGQQFSSLDELKKAGHVTDEWSRWQQGNCCDYARGLQKLNPSLHFGTLVEHDGDFDVPVHHFAHDDKFAYDSAGKHPLPYHGIQGDLTPRLHDRAEDYDIPDEGEVHAAMSHARRNRILERE